MNKLSTTSLPKDIAAEKGLVNIQIDGVWMQVPKGTRIIEACNLAKAQVPHYCYHEKLSSPGNCRMCLVQMGMPPRPAPGAEPVYDEQGYQEISWNPRPIISCANTVAENMGIKTQGELVEGCRKDVMEFLLINHPLDCPICDQAGECTLQEYSVEHGQAQSRFKETKVKKPKNVRIGERIRLDDERCVLCSRCIRFMDEVADDPVLGFAERGTHSKLTVHPDKLLNHNYSLNTVDICPVGALTSTDFRFQMRVWFLKQTSTIDTNCGHGVNTTVWTRGNDIYRVTPRQNDAVNSCWMPDNYRLSFKNFKEELRLLEPTQKVKETHQPIHWTKAFASINEQLGSANSENTALIVSASLTNEELYLAKTLAEKLDIKTLASVEHKQEEDKLLISSDANPNTLGLQLIFKLKTLYKKLGSIKTGIKSGTIKNLIVLGEDLTTIRGWDAELLSHLDCLISTHSLANATAQASDYSLPVATAFENQGTMINLSGRLQKLNAATKAPTAVKTHFQLLTNWLHSLGVNHLATQPEALFIELSETYKALNGITYGSLSDLGEPIIETNYQVPLLAKEQQRRNQGIIA